MPHRHAFFFAAIGLALTAQSLPEVTSTGKDRTGLAVTIFHNDVALVRDQRKVRLPKGQIQLAMTDLAASIRQSSAWLWMGKGIPPISERSFEFNLLTPRKLFRSSLGKEGKFRINQGEKPIQGTLLSQPSYSLDPLLVQNTEGITSVQAHQVLFRDLPTELRTNPTLLHSLTTTGGDQPLELTYLADHFRWKPHYVFSLKPDGRHLDLQAWAEVKNTSGLDLPACTLQLIAGTPNQLPFDEARDLEPPWEKLPPLPSPPKPPRPPVAPTTQTATVEVVASAAEFQETSFFEYVLYTLNQPVSIRDNQAKQLSLFQAKNIPVDLSVRILFEQTSDAVFDNGTVNPLLTLRKWFENKGLAEHSGNGKMESDPEKDVPNLSTLLKVTNDEAHQLGRAMPAGDYILFYESPEGAPIKISEDSIDPLPRGSNQELFLPGISGVNASKSLIGKVKKSWIRLFVPWSRRIAFELEATVTVQNNRSHSVKVEVREFLPLDWKIFDNTHAFSRRSELPEFVDFQLEIPAHTAQLLRYRVATPLFAIPKALSK